MFIAQGLGISFSFPAQFQATIAIEGIVKKLLPVLFSPLRFSAGIKLIEHRRKYTINL